MNGVLKQIATAALSGVTVSAAVIAIDNGSFETVVTSNPPSLSFFDPGDPTDWDLDNPNTNSIQFGVVNVTPYQSQGNYTHTQDGGVVGLGPVGTDDRIMSLQMNSYAGTTAPEISQQLGIDYDPQTDYQVSIQLGRRLNGFNGVTALGEITIMLRQGSTVLASNTITDYQAGHTNGTFIQYDLDLTPQSTTAATGNIELVFSYFATNQQPGSQVPRYSGAIDFNVITLDAVPPVPEMSSTAMLAMSSLALCRRRRKRER